MWRSTKPNVDLAHLNSGMCLCWRSTTVTDDLVIFELCTFFIFYVFYVFCIFHLFCIYCIFWII
jgi:hypothetical protein